MMELEKSGAEHKTPRWQEQKVIDDMAMVIARNLDGDINYRSEMRQLTDLAALESLAHRAGLLMLHVPIGEELEVGTRKGTTLKVYHYDRNGHRFEVNQ